MRAGQGRGLESVISSARQRAASLLESVASGRLSAEQALGLWPDGRGDDPDIAVARGVLRRHPAPRSLAGAARALRSGRSLQTPTERRRLRLPAGRGRRQGGTALAAGTRLALGAAGLALLGSAVWLLAVR